MKTSGKLTIMLLAIISVFAACKKDPTPTTTGTGGSLAVTMTNTADSGILALGQQYRDANGDSLSISIFNYYMSNIVLNSSTGAAFAEPNSYHLVQQSISTSWNYSIANVPAGSYTSMTFMIGVDSLHNVSGAQTGALDPLNGMFWDWNTGYIMAKMEGNTGSPSHLFQFHIGGFSGQYNALRTVTLTFPQPIQVSTGGQSMVYLHANALSWFKAPHVINLNTFSSTMIPNANSVMIADNYANMFGADSVK